VNVPGVRALGLLLLALSFAPCRARADETAPKPEELFQWGEYDSLIRSLEPVLASLSAGATARGDSVELAKANLWLGVAYWATEKRTLAEQAFRRACRLDRGLVLDRLYATPEIVERFESISIDERKERQDSALAALDALGVSAGPSSPEGGAPPGAKPEPAVKPWRKRGWALGALTAVGLAAGGTLYYVANRKDDDIIIVDPVKSE